MKNRTLFLIILVFISHSCGIFKTHHKDKLLDFESDLISNKTLKLNGYYFTEWEQEYGEDTPPFIDDYIEKTGIRTIKHLSVFFLYEDGFVIAINRINGLSRYYCAEKENYENTYESAHETIKLMLESQHSTNRRTKRLCGFNPNAIGNKGLVKVNNDSIKIQTYSIEYQSTPGAGNSAYLYELNGTIQSDSSFVLKSETKFKTKEITSKNSVFRFRKTDQKPNVENYFKKHRNRFK